MSALSDKLMKVTKGMTITARYFKEDTAHPEIPAVPMVKHSTHILLTQIMKLVLDLVRQTKLKLISVCTLISQQQIATTQQNIVGQNGKALMGLKVSQGSLEQMVRRHIFISLMLMTIKVLTLV